MNDSKPIPQDTREKFRELGTCSRTFFYLLNREFGYPAENEERAAAPLAGGMQRGGLSRSVLNFSERRLRSSYYATC
jgi:hypothetical protein